jgi:hypothetical protein
MRIRTFVVAVLVFGAQAGRAQPTQPASRPAAETTLELRLSRFIDLHYFVRHQSQATTTIPALEGLADAAMIARELETTLGGALGWGLIEGTLAECADSAEALEACARLPENFTDRGGRSIPIREGTLRLVRAYSQIEPAFLKDIWPRHRELIEQTRNVLTDKLLPKQAACFGYMVDRLGMQDPHLTIPVYLVAEAPAPGAVTHRRRGGGGVCFISADSGPAALLPEIVLHEAIHALDIATADQDTALQALRKALREAGLDPKDPLSRDVPHTLMFVMAGETVRHVLDPALQHYGDAAGYYAKVPAATAAVRPAWTEYLDGKLTRAAAVARIVAETVKPRTPGE